MRKFHSKGGPTKIQLFYTMDEIEATCMGELKKTGLLPDDPEPIRIDRFIEKRFGIVPKYIDLDAGLLGFTRFGANGVEEICITSAFDEEGTQTAERRLRTTLAHEAGHGLLHAHLFALEKKSKKIFKEGHDDTPRVLCRDVSGTETQTKYSGQWWEYQANIAMGALLLPKNLVQKAMIPYLKSSGLLSSSVLDVSKKENAILNLSTIFDVNPIVVRIRINKLFPLTK